MTNRFRILSGVLAVAVTLSLAALPASAAKVRVRNCVADRVFVCAYNSHDNAFTIAADTGGIQPGQRKSFKCSTNRCKVFLAMSNKTASKTFNAMNSVLPGIVGGSVGGSVVLSTVIMAGTNTAWGVLMGATAGGLAVGVAAGIGVVAGIDALETGARCKKIIKAAKKADLKRKTNDNFTVIARMVDDETPAIVLEDGAGACSAD